MKRWHWIALGLAVAASIVAGLLAHQEPGHGHWWDAIPGFYAFYGIAGACAVIYLSWLLGRWFLHREADYYDQSDQRNEAGPEDGLEDGSEEGE